MGIRTEAGAARVLRPDLEDRAPLGEASPKPGIFREAFPQSIQAFGDRIARAEREWLCAVIHLDTGDYLLPPEHFDQRCSIGRVLADRLVEENDTRNMFVQSGG